MTSVYDDVCNRLIDGGATIDAVNTVSSKSLLILMYFKYFNSLVG